MYSFLSMGAKAGKFFRLPSLPLHGRLVLFLYIILLVSGTIFQPLPYLRVTVLRLSGLSFTPSTKQISFFLVSNFQS